MNLVDGYFFPNFRFALFDPLRFRVLPSHNSSFPASLILLEVGKLSVAGRGLVFFEIRGYQFQESQRSRSY
jgi:hypothetical protein